MGSNGGGRSKGRRPTEKGPLGGGGKQGRPASISKARRKRLEIRQEELTACIDTAEARIEQIDELFCEANYYEQTPLEEVTTLENERTGLHREVVDLMGEWERNEEEIGS